MKREFTKSPNQKKTTTSSSSLNFIHLFEQKAPPKKTGKLRFLSPKRCPPPKKKLKNTTYNSHPVQVAVKEEMNPIAQDVKKGTTVWFHGEAEDSPILVLKKYSNSHRIPKNGVYTLLIYHSLPLKIQPNVGI